MTRFSTDQLTTFATVIEYGTFDAAADILRVSPSAISQRIKAMEQIAGKVLVRRSNPVTPPTPDKAYCASPDRANSSQQEMERELMGAGGFQSVSVAVNADSRHLVPRRSRNPQPRRQYLLRPATRRRIPLLRHAPIWRSHGSHHLQTRKNPRMLRRKPSAWHATGALPPPTTYSGTCPAGPRL